MKGSILNSIRYLLKNKICKCVFVAHSLSRTCYEMYEMFKNDEITHLFNFLYGKKLHNDTNMLRLLYICFPIHISNLKDQLIDNPVYKDIYKKYTYIKLDPFYYKGPFGHIREKSNELSVCNFLDQELLFEFDDTYNSSNYWHVTNQETISNDLITNRICECCKEHVEGYPKINVFFIRYMYGLKLKLL